MCVCCAGVRAASGRRGRPARRRAEPGAATPGGSHRIAKVQWVPWPRPARRRGRAPVGGRFREPDRTPFFRLTPAFGLRSLRKNGYLSAARGICSHSFITNDRILTSENLSNSSHFWSSWRRCRFLGRLPRAGRVGAAPRSTVGVAVRPPPAALGSTVGVPVPPPAAARRRTAAPLVLAPAGCRLPTPRWQTGRRRDRKR